MMKDVTILTFDEMEKIRQELDHIIDNAKNGAYGEYNAKEVCSWIMCDLRNLKINWFES